MHRGMGEWRPVVMPGAETFEMVSARTGETYRVLVRRPAGAAPERGWPALWMLDGDASFPLTFAKPAHGLFAPATADPGGAGVIVAVGFPGGAPFDAPARSRNYTPTPDRETGDSVSTEFGGASDFLHFLTQELRPALAARLPLDPDRNTLFGFSYGGLFTLHALLAHHGHFQRYWAASPSLWFSGGLMMRRLRQAPPVIDAQRLVLTVGRDEQCPAHALPPARLEHLARRAMVDNVREAAGLIAAANPGLRSELIVAGDHDHFDMLMHGARRVQALAFGEGEAD